jgi:hypothetical protein
MTGLVMSSWPGEEGEDANSATSERDAEIRGFIGDIFMNLSGLRAEKAVSYLASFPGCPDADKTENFTGMAKKWLYKAGGRASFRAPVGTRDRLHSNHFPS